MDTVSSSQQQLAHNNNSLVNHHQNSSIGGGGGGGMGSNNGNTQVLQELFRQQHLQTQSLTYGHHSPQVSNFSNTGIVDSNNLNSTTSADDYNLIFNMAMRGSAAAGTSTNGNHHENNIIVPVGSTGGGGVATAANSTAAVDQDAFMIQQMSMLSQQSHNMMQPHHHHQSHHQQHYSTNSMGLSPHHSQQQHHHSNSIVTANNSMYSHPQHHHNQQQHHNSQSSLGYATAGAVGGNIQDNILTFLGGSGGAGPTQQEVVVDHHGGGHIHHHQHHNDDLLLNNSATNNQVLQQQISQAVAWRGAGDKVNFSSYFHDGSIPSSSSVVQQSGYGGGGVEHSQNGSMIVDNSNNHHSQLHGVNSSTSIDEVKPYVGGMFQHDNAFTNQMNGNHFNHHYSTTPLIQNHHLPVVISTNNNNQQQQQTSAINNNLMASSNNGNTMIKKQTKQTDSPKLNIGGDGGVGGTDPGREVTNCHCCGRSDAEVSFKKNYSIHEGNIESYRNTFPQNIDQITSGPVCATCYNKQWRFQRGLYDPQKMRKANPREGIKQRLKDCDSTGSPLTPTFPSSSSASLLLNNRVSAIQQSDYSPTTSSPTRGGGTPTGFNKNKRKLTVSTANTNPMMNGSSTSVGGGGESSDNDNNNQHQHLYHESKRSKQYYSSMNSPLSESSDLTAFSYRNKNPDEISIIVQFYQVDNELIDNDGGGGLVDQINEFNQIQLRIQKQEMFGVQQQANQEKVCKHFHQFYTTALKVNKKHFDVSQQQLDSNLQLIQGKLALENIKQLLTDRATQFKQIKMMEDPKTSTSTCDTGSNIQQQQQVAEAGVNISSTSNRVLCVKISTQDRFKNTILADVDEFFFVDKNLSEGDSIHVFLQ